MKKLDSKTWLTSIDPLEMWLFLDGSVTERKSRLFAVACCRRIWPQLIYQESREAVELAERSADEPISDSELDLVSGGAEWAYEDSLTDENGVNRSDDDPIPSAAYAASYASNPGLSPFDVSEVIQSAAEGSALGANEEFATQANLLRDIVGDPSRDPVLDANWLAWDDRLIVKLAQGIYEDRAFDRMPILGDALEEAGCTDEAILSHCRGPGLHVRGCWLVDSILEKH